MPTIAIISQKGGAGKTTLAINLAAAAERASEVALIIDTDPQTTASQWAEWRGGAPPEVIDSASPRIAAKVGQALRRRVFRRAGLAARRSPATSRPRCRLQCAFALGATA